MKISDSWFIKLNEQRYKCLLCDVIKPSEKSVISHYWRLHTEKGKNHKSGRHKGCVAWSIGLTKETDARVKKMSESISAKLKSGEIIPPFKGKHHTDETKKKLSDNKRKYYQEHPEEIPWVKWNTKDETYPEKYFREVFEKYNIPLKQWLQFGPYELDFYNEDYKINFEIDGDWHLSEKHKEKDIARDAYVSSKGWRTIRILWCRWKKKTNEEKQQIINDIKGLFEGKDLQYYEEYKSREKPKLNKKYCMDCGCEITNDKKTMRCISCARKASITQPMIKLDKEELLKYLGKEPVVTTAKRFKITDNGLKKYCIRNKIDFPKFPRGYWTKNKEG